MNALEGVALWGTIAVTLVSLAAFVGTLIIAYTDRLKSYRQSYTEFLEQKERVEEQLKQARPKKGPSKNRRAKQRV